MTLSKPVYEEYLKIKHFTDIDVNDTLSKPGYEKYLKMIFFLQVWTSIKNAAVNNTQSIKRNKLPFHGWLTSRCDWSTRVIEGILLDLVYGI